MSPLLISVVKHGSGWTISHSTLWLTQNHLTGDSDSQETCDLPAHWDPRRWLGKVGHTHLKFKMLWLHLHLSGPKSGPEIHYKCVFCKESLTQPPQWQLHTSDYFLAFCLTRVYKHTQRLRLEPAKTSAHVAKMLPRLSDILRCELTSGPGRPQVEPCGKSI